MPSRLTKGPSMLLCRSDRPLPDRRYDAWLAEAVEVLLDEDPHLLDPPDGFSDRLARDKFIEYLTQLVRETDARDNRKLNAPVLARWVGCADSTIRGILGRHPLIPRVQAVRAALELQHLGSDSAMTGVIKVFAGTHKTTSSVRGVHRPSPTSREGRQMHLEFVVITAGGRAILVSTE